jgi:hypothetical protein
MDEELTTPEAQQDPQDALKAKREAATQRKRNQRAREKAEKLEQEAKAKSAQLQAQAQQESADLDDERRINAEGLAERAQKGVVFFGEKYPNINVETPAEALQVAREFSRALYVANVCQTLIPGTAPNDSWLNSIPSRTEMFERSSRWPGSSSDVQVGETVFDYERRIWHVWVNFHGFVGRNDCCGRSGIMGGGPLLHRKTGVLHPGRGSDYWTSGGGFDMKYVALPGCDVPLTEADIPELDELSNGESLQLLTDAEVEDLNLEETGRGAK